MNRCFLAYKYRNMQNTCFSAHMNAVVGRDKILHTHIRPQTLFRPWTAFQRGDGQKCRKYIQEHSRGKAT